MKGQGEGTKVGGNDSDVYHSDVERGGSGASTWWIPIG